MWVLGTLTMAQCALVPAKAEAETRGMALDHWMSSVQSLCGHRASASSHSEVLALSYPRGYYSAPRELVPQHLARAGPSRAELLGTYSHTCV